MEPSPQAPPSEATNLGPGEYFRWLENPRDDFPYYNIRPIGLSAPQWWLVMGAVAIGFGLLVAPIGVFANKWGQFVPAILFFAIPLAALAYVTPRHWQAIFRKVGWRDVLWMFAFWILNMIVTVIVGLVVIETSGANANKAISGLEIMEGADRVAFFLKTLPQLFGEEVITILPFLALMTLFVQHFHWRRRWAIAGAWLGSAVMFGLLHLPSYDWNILQCIVVIGSARLMLSLAYIKTKNIWVSTGAHIINDWFIFATAILGSQGGAT